MNQKNYLLIDLLTAMCEAAKEGFTHIFYLEDGGILHSPTILGKVYFISKVTHPVMPLPLEFGNLYHIETHDGEKGVLFLSHDREIE